MWERIFVISAQRIHPGAARAAHADPAVRAAAWCNCIVFGFAVNLDVDHARIAWMDMDRTPASRDLRERFEGSGRFDVVALPRNEAEVHADCSTAERAQAVVRVLPNFERDIKRGVPTQVQVLIDGTNSNTAALVSSYAQEIVADYASRRIGAAARTRVS